MSVCAVVVTYQPAEDIVGNVTALLTQVDAVIIADNGSSGDSVGFIRLLSKYPAVQVIYNGDNLGIGAALNIGIKSAGAAGHEWIATFDQDSRATPGMIDRMLTIYDSDARKETIAVLCPRYRDTTTGRVVGHADGCAANDMGTSEVLVTMTSGNLARAAIFERVGYFDESFFIDYVDYEFCLRCAQNGYRILEVASAELQHRVGDPTRHRLFGMTFLVSNHSAARRYYGFRNRVHLYRLYASAYPGLLTGIVIGSLKELLKVLLFEDHAVEKLSAAIRGSYDGLRGRSGRIRS